MPGGMRNLTQKTPPAPTTKVSPGAFLSSATCRSVACSSGVRMNQASTFQHSAIDRLDVARKAHCNKLLL